MVSETRILIPVGKAQKKDVLIKNTSLTLDMAVQE